MKFSQIYTFLPAVIAFFLLATIVTENANAQMFGNGRFLRRVRDDLFGAPEPPKPEQKNKSSKSPTPAVRPSKQTNPTDAAKNSNARSRQTTVNQSPPKSRQHQANDLVGNRLPKESTPSRGTSSRSTSSRGTSSRETANRLAKDPVRSNAAATLGFGMLVQLRSKQLFVTQIDPDGNSAKAGIRAGDQLVTGGGIEFESLSDFNGIADILSDGDQLEFEVARGGRKNKLLVQFGETKEADAGDLEISYENARIDDSQNGDSGINNINTRDNNSFMPTPRNIRQAPRPQATQPRATSIRSNSKNTRQITQPRSSNQTIGSQRQDNRGPQLQLPSNAESVLNIN